MNKKALTILLVVLASVAMLLDVGLSSAKTTAEKIVEHSFPKLANYYLSTPLNDSIAQDLAKWDLVVLSMQAQDNSMYYMKKMRSINPDIVILAYIPSEEFPITKYSQWESNSTGVWHTLLSGITDDMWLKDASGQHVAFWHENWMLNVSNYQSSKQRWNEYLSGFAANKIIGTGLWDGVFFDNVFTNISAINNGKIDIDNDKSNDSAGKLNQLWQTGMDNLFTLTRSKAGDIVIIGNGDRGYYDYLNGHYFENFNKDKEKLWSEKMRLYQESVDKNERPVVSIIGDNASNQNADKYNWQRVRFGLASALLEDGYYAYDYGDQDHSQLWWYDEYDVDLGNAISSPVSQTGSVDYKSDVWQRNFVNGLAVVNSSGQTKLVNLGGEYEKIHGTQDSDVNDGSIVTETEIDGYDGLILLKTFTTINNVLFRNGDFLRFFDAKGNRVRNGFFVFEDGYKGGDKIIHTDLNGNGKAELLVVHKNKILAWRDDGMIYMNRYPYTANYQGELNIAVGDLNGDGNKEVYVAPSAGYNLPIKVYNRLGKQMRQDRYPLGEGYKGGYSIGVGNIDGGKGKELLIGAGQGVKPQVLIYDYEFDKRLYEWLAFDYWFNGGINVTAGDVNGDDVDEIIVGSGPGQKPLIRVFDKSGVKLYPEFVAYQSLTNPGIEVLSADVDYDGKDDIIGMSTGF